MRRDRLVDDLAFVRTSDERNDDWEALVRRSAAATVRRIARRRTREARWNRRLAALDRGALAAGAALLVAFPIVGAELRAVQAAADEFLLTTTAAETEIEAEAFGAFSPDVDASFGVSIGR